MHPPRSRGYFGVAAWRPRHEANVGGLWRSAAAFDAAFCATVGRRYAPTAADTPKVARHTPLWHFSGLDDLLSHMPDGCALIGVELDPRARPLGRFVHPDRALYLLGSERDGLPVDVLDECDHLVTVPTAVSWSLNVATAGSIVLSDRYSQRGRRVRATV